MKKFSDILLKIFSVGIVSVLFAGALALVGFIVALVIGGETATEICVFIHKTYFPYIIRFTPIFVAFGLIGMYLSKAKALTVSGNSSDDKKE